MASFFQRRFSLDFAVHHYAIKRDWINSGTIKMLFTISEHSYREPEVGVKFCMNNFTKLVYCIVFL